MEPMVLTILDGWGYREETSDNTLKLAHLPTWNRLWAENPHTLIRTDGPAVGLPSGQMGNSEVGHMNIGAGRIALPEFGRIDAMLGDNTMAEVPEFQEFIQKLLASKGKCHLVGLLSEGGVHSHQDQMGGFAKLVAAAGIDVWIHAFTDGRDTPPQSALEFFEKFEQDIRTHPLIRWGTLGGRYWGMDRDNRWERVERAYGAIMRAESDIPHLPHWKMAIEAAYERGETDEFMAPTVMSEYTGFQENDGILMANFRADRARQLLSAFVNPDFDGFDRQAPVVKIAVSAVQYAAPLVPFAPPLVRPLPYPQTIGEVVSKSGLKQLRLAETEKYAHVTFFLSGGIEAPFEGEERILVPSPKVATYDLSPAMSAHTVTNHLVEAIEGQQFGLIIVNYANPDMVGHTGSLEAAKQAVETIDACLLRIEQAVRRAKATWLITADHGNVELMKDARTGSPHTQHTTCPVPLVLIQGGDSAYALTTATGKLADLAPTALTLMGLNLPEEMTGDILVQKVS